MQFNSTIVSTLILVGILGGMLTVTAGMGLIVSAFPRLPGAQSARYWALGMASIGLGAALFVTEFNVAGLLFSSVIFGFLLAGVVLLWQGLRIFHLREPSPDWKQIVGLFVCLFSLSYLVDAPFGVRLAAIALLGILVFALWMQEIFLHYRPHFNNLVRLAMFACGSLILDACVMLYDGLFGELQSFPTALTLRVLLVLIIIPILALNVYTGALLTLYFHRIAESKNYAATHDELTGLLNRRAIMQYGRREVEVALRSHQPLVVAFADIDHFKKINDTYGHDQGDIVLREVARLLSLTCRSVDLVGRYGGEEFCMVFVGGAVGGVEIVGERLVAALRGQVFPGVPAVTISVGLASLDNSAGSSSWDELVHLADLELYKAKQAGRDRYSIFHPARPGSAPAIAPAAHGPLQQGKNTVMSILPL